MLIRHVNIKGTDIHVFDGVFKPEIEIEHVFEFQNKQPTIRVFVGQNLFREFNIEAIEENPDLTGQFLHSSIRVLKNGAVMIDGIVSNDRGSHATWEDNEYEAVRFQPFYLDQSENEKLRGAGLFERGLHFSGTVTPLGVRAICICDECKKSFTLQHYHAGFSECQYFYSSDGRQTLSVHYSEVPNMPTQLQRSIDEGVLEAVERQLPKPTIGTGAFKYYNPLRCPHCGDAFVDFEKRKDQRPTEYYATRLVNHPLQKFSKA